MRTDEQLKVMHEGRGEKICEGKSPMGRTRAGKPFGATFAKADAERREGCNNGIPSV